jgi:hypothetical protein
MKYIIMCGGKYDEWETPRQLVWINSEPIVVRTIRLLRENNIRDIAISSNNPIFKQYGVPVLTHENNWVVPRPHVSTGDWCDAFYPTDEPTCYLMGDVVFSPEAIKKIVETETDDIEFFASAPPFAKNYCKPYAEPFAFKVVDTEHLKKAQIECKQSRLKGLFRRPPLAWEFWQVVKGTPYNIIKYDNYTVINDYTCDIDVPEDAKKIERCMNG